jgi:hypothetical protein
MRWTWLLLIAVTAVVAIGYSHTLPYAFNFDDVSSIRDNRTLDDPGIGTEIRRGSPSM